MTTHRVEITVSDEVLAGLDVARGHEPRASFVKRALERALYQSPPVIDVGGVKVHAAVAGALKSAYGDEESPSPPSRASVKRPAKSPPIPTTLAFKCPRHDCERRFGSAAAVCPSHGCRAVPV